MGADVYGGEGLSSGNTLYHNNFVNNKQQIKNFGGNPSNLWDNGAQGNYWSDYRGVDVNGDGIGDTPYLIQAEKFDLSANGIVEAVSGKDNYPLMAPFDVSSVTIDLPTWNYTPPDSLTPLTSPSQEPSVTAAPKIASPTSVQPATNQEPASTPTAKQPEPSPTSTVIVAGIIAAGLLIEAAILYVRRLNHK